MRALAFDALLRAIGGRYGVFDVPCPICGPEKHAPVNRARKVFRIWHTSRSFVGFCCARCGEEGFVRDDGAPREDASTIVRVRAELDKYNRAATAERLDKALSLWRRRQPLHGSPAEKYLRSARAYGGPLPPTLGYLPPRDDYPPVMIAAFGIPNEPEHHAMVLPDAKVKGVHLTRLKPDGIDRDRSEKAKIMIGHSKGWPIVLSPPTDGLALVISEGIESTLSGVEATGLCGWSAGSASRLPALADALPRWAECITILADDDVDGRRHATALASAAKAHGVGVRLMAGGAVG